MIQHHSFHRYAIDEIGMPNMDYEIFYQQGISCYCWGYRNRISDWLCARFAGGMNNVSDQ